jgi:hypothetical protein
MQRISVLLIKAYLIADNHGNVWAMRSTIAAAMEKASELHGKHPLVRYKIHEVTKTQIVKQEAFH